MTQLVERRFINLELRSTTQGSKRSITGYAATWDTPFSKQMTRAMGFSERIARGAFSRALREKQDVICTRDHDPKQLLGRVSNGTLQLSEDSKGLRFSCDCPDTQAARDLHTLIQRGDIKGCSFSFIPTKERWGKEKNRDNGNLQATREIQDCDLLDVSCVAQPAYDVGTSVDAREDFEDYDDDEDDDTAKASLQEMDGGMANSFLRSMFPNGVPVEVRSRMRIVRRKSGIVTAEQRNEMELELMRMRVEIALRD
jgi:hypothetical protein